MKFRILIFFGFLTSCSPSKHLVYIDNWEGEYKLWELNSCCNKKTSITLNVERKGLNNYDWKLNNDSFGCDTLKGFAKYIKKKLNFFVTDLNIANKYFRAPISINSKVFCLMYDNYSSDNEKLYIENFTSWNNYLKGYKNKHTLFSGTDFHFRKGNNDQKIILIDTTKNNKFKKS